MRRLPVLALVGLLSASLTGCTTDSGNIATDRPTTLTSTAASAVTNAAWGVSGGGSVVATDPSEAMTRAVTGGLRILGTAEVADTPQELTVDLGAGATAGSEVLARWDPQNIGWDPVPTYVSGARIVAFNVRPGTWAALAGTDPIQAIGPAPTADTADGAVQLSVVQFEPAAAECGVDLPTWADQYDLTTPTGGAVTVCLTGDPEWPTGAILRVTSDRSYAQVIETDFNLGFPAPAPPVRAAVPLPAGFGTDLQQPDQFGITGGKVDSGVSDSLLLPGQSLVSRLDEADVQRLAADSAQSAGSSPSPIHLWSDPAAVAAGAVWLAAQRSDIGLRALLTRYAAQATSACGIPATAPDLDRAILDCLDSADSRHLWLDVATPALAHRYDTADPGSGPPPLDRMAVAAAVAAAAVQLAQAGLGPTPVSLRVSSRAVVATPTPQACQVPSDLTAWTQTTITGEVQLWAYDLGNGRRGPALLVLKRGEATVDCKFVPEGSGIEVFDITCTDRTPRPQCLLAAQSGAHSSVTTFVEIADNLGAMAVSASGHASPTTASSFADLDGDGDLDIVDEFPIYDDGSSYAEGRRRWATFRQDPVGVFVRTGCSAEIETESAEPPTALLADPQLCI